MITMSNLKAFIKETGVGFGFKSVYQLLNSVGIRFTTLAYKENIFKE